MDYRIRIIDNEQNESFYDIKGKFIKIGSDKECQIALLLESVPAMVCLVEFDQKNTRFRIHSRCAGLLNLNDRILDEGDIEIWQIGEPLTIADTFTLTSEKVEQHPVSAKKNVAQMRNVSSSPQIDSAKSVSPKQRRDTTKTPTAVDADKKKKNSDTTSLLIIALAAVVGIFLLLNILFEPQSNQSSALSFDGFMERMENPNLNYKGTEEGMKVFLLISEAHFMEGTSRQDAIRLYTQLRDLLDSRLKQERGETRNEVVHRLETDLMRYVVRRIYHLK